MKTVFFQVLLCFVLYQTEISAEPVCTFFFDTVTCSNFTQSDMDNLNPALITKTDSEKLRFEDCHFDHIPVEFFTPFQGKLKEIRIAKCGISRLLENNFIKAPELVSIDLSKNEITEIKPEMFSGLNKLKNLRLNENKIEKLDKQVFKTLPLLDIIGFADNKISHFEKNLFKDLVNARFLDLSENPINGEIHLEFKSMVRLLVISCGLTKIRIDGNISGLSVSKNQITEIIIPKSDNFKSLDISYTPLKNICVNIPCGKIESLKVEGNPVDYKKMEEEIKLMPNLEQLSLANTNLQILDKKLLEPLTKLQYLNISGNNLSEMDFELMRNLVTLSLAKTNLSTLNKKLFEPLVNLKNLDITGNNLQEVDLDVFTQLNLNMIELQDNPWKCSSLHPIIKEYIETDVNRHFAFGYMRHTNNIACT